MRYKTSDVIKKVNFVFSFRSDTGDVSRRVEFNPEQESVEEIEHFPFATSTSAYGTLSTNSELLRYNFYNDIHAY